MLCNFIEITLRHGCSAVNLLHIFRTSFPGNTSGWLLQKHNILCYLLYTHMTVERAKSRRLKIANVNFRRLVIKIKQDYPVFWQTDKLQVINPEFCDQNVRKIVCFWRGVEPFQAIASFIYIASSWFLLAKYAKYTFEKVSYLGRFQNSA